MASPNTVNNNITNAPQGNFQSNQNYDVDIKLLFKHYVTGGNTPDDNEPGENIGIDDIRGQISVSVTGTKTADLIKSLNINPVTNTPAPTPNTTTPVLLAQESRCHAFYRIIGLPVVAADQTFYNPGFDIIKTQGKPRGISLTTKITIASNVGLKFESISAAREKWAANTSQIFSVPTSVQAGVLSLTSGTYGEGGAINIRDFNILKDVIPNEPFDYNPADQTYAVFTQSCQVGGNGAQLLTNFQDANANTIAGTFPNTSTNNISPIYFQHLHIIAPFTVDPRIDFSIWSNESKTVSGVSRRIAVPFVPDASYLQVSSTATAERPVIEHIIRDRIYQANNIPAAGDTIANAQSLIMSNKNIGNITFVGSTPISNIFSGSIFNQSRQNAFADTLSNIQTMMNKLVIALHNVQYAQGLYYWLPVPSAQGPEGGSDIRDVPLNPNFLNELITDKDFDIINNQVQVLFSGIDIAASQANAVPDIGGYAFSHPIFGFGKSTTDALGDVSGNTMDTLVKTRNKVLTDAGNALQVIEMIMGEFSGLGLCDIIAIVGALKTMPIADLLGFLDTDSYARAVTLLGPGLPAQNPSIANCLNSLTQEVSAFYQIMNQTFIDALGNAYLTTQ